MSLKTKSPHRPRWHRPKAGHKGKAVPPRRFALLAPRNHTRHLGEESARPARLRSTSSSVINLLALERRHVVIKRMARQVKSNGLKLLVQPLRRQPVLHRRKPGSGRSSPASPNRLTWLEFFCSYHSRRISHQAFKAVKHTAAVAIEHIKGPRPAPASPGALAHTLEVHPSCKVKQRYKRRSPRASVISFIASTPTFFSPPSA